MTDPAQQTAPVRTSTTHPLEISTGDVVRPDTGDILTLGITLMPGLVAEGVHGGDWDRDLATDIDAVRAWAPDIVLVIEDPGHEETVDTLASELGEGMVHTVDTDAWPVPEDPDIRAERREILCNVLSLVAGRTASRVLIVSDRGAQEAVSLAVEMLMISGVYTDKACRAVEAIRPGHFDTGAQSGYLGAMPEERRGGGLGLPLSGGLLAVMTDGTGVAGHFVVRADGMHRLETGDPDELRRRIAAPFATMGPSGVSVAAADLVSGDIPEIRDGLVHQAGRTTPLTNLKFFADKASDTMRTRDLASRCAFQLGLGWTLTYYGRISEATYRAIPQGAAA